MVADVFGIATGTYSGVRPDIHAYHTCYPPEQGLEFRLTHIQIIIIVCIIISSSSTTTTTTTTTMNIIVAIIIVICTFIIIDNIYIYIYYQ